MEVKKLSGIENWEENKLEHKFEDGTELRAEPYITVREPPEWSSTISVARRPSNRIYWVKTNCGKVFEFGDESAAANRNKAGAMAVLWVRSGGFKIGDDESMIPTAIAAMGKPAMAAYLDVTQDVNRNQIGELLQVSKGTVEQYVSKLRRGHR